MNREHVSKAQITGNLGQDPEAGFLDNGTPYVRLSIATSERYTDRSGQIRDRTEWHRATAWGPIAEQVAAQNFEKGDSITVAGNLRINSYEAHDAKHRVNEIEVTEATRSPDRTHVRNEVRLVGVVREEPKTRELESGAKLTTISLATKTISNGKEREDWHSLTAWGGAGAAAAKEVKVGDTLSVNGPLRHREVENNDGSVSKRSAIEVAKFQILEHAKDHHQKRHGREDAASNPDRTAARNGPSPAESAPPSRQRRRSSKSRGIEM